MIDLLPTYHVIKFSSDVAYTLKVSINTQGSPLDMSAIQEIECFIGALNTPLPNLKMSQGNIAIGDTENTIFLQIPAFKDFLSYPNVPTTLEFSIIMTTNSLDNLLISHGLFYVH